MEDFHKCASLFRASLREAFLKSWLKLTEHTTKVMADAFQEAKGDPSLWHDPHFATYGHTRNSYTNANSHPTIFDYIFLRKSTMDPGEIWVKSFSLPDLHIVKPATKTQISISDHEGVASHLFMETVIGWSVEKLVVASSCWCSTVNKPIQNGGDADY